MHSIKITKAPFSPNVPVTVNGAKTVRLPIDTEIQVTDAQLGVLQGTAGVECEIVDSVSRAQSAGAGVVPGGNDPAPTEQQQAEAEAEEAERAAEAVRLAEVERQAAAERAEQERADEAERAAQAERDRIAGEEAARQAEAERAAEAERGAAQQEEAARQAEAAKQVDLTILDQSIPKILEALAKGDFTAAQLTALRDAESAGKTRSTLIAALDDLLAPQGDN